jgi:methylthioribose-1-phosphate isomerase
VNKIGTYLKALAAQDNRLPFYVALPSSSIDWTLAAGTDVPIETRPASEVCRVTGIDAASQPRSIEITPAGSDVVNYAFDVTPAHLVTGLITERGICEPNETSMRRMFAETIGQ